MSNLARIPNVGRRAVQWGRLRGRLVVLFAGFLVLTATGAHAKAREGTDPKDLASRGLSAPGEIAVAVMPFAVRPEARLSMPRGLLERQVEGPRACALLNLGRHGFRIVPEAESLSLIPSLTDKAMDLHPDDKLEGDIGRAEALAAAKELGADWVIFGEFMLKMDFTVRLFKTRPIKVIRTNLHLVVADVASEEVIYWTRVEDDVRGSSVSHGMDANAEDAGKARQLLVDMVNEVFDEIGKAMPVHETGEPVTRKQFEDFLGSMGL